MAFDEKAYFQEKPENPAGQVAVSALQARQRIQHPLDASDQAQRPPAPRREDRAKFDKLRDHLLRLDDEVTCKTCGKKFEVPSHQSLMFTDQLEGLPKDDEDADQLEETAALGANRSSEAARPLHDAPRKDGAANRTLV